MKKLIKKEEFRYNRIRYIREEYHDASHEWTNLAGEIVSVTMGIQLEGEYTQLKREGYIKK